MLDGRVKTLHPRIHGGLLARRDLPEHMAALGRARHRHHRPGGGQPLPVREAPSRKPGCTLEEAIENIDIGGPAMLRAAAKNWHDVAVVDRPRRLRRACSAELRRTAACARRPRASRWRRRSSPTPRPTTARSATTSTRCVGAETRAAGARPFPARLHAAVRPRCRTCATARTRTRARRSTAIRRPAAGTLAGWRAAAGQGTVATTTSPTPTRPGNA